MKTTFFVYLAIWLLLVVPLLGFNIPKMRTKLPGGGKKVNAGRIITVAVIAVIASGLCFALYQDNITTRYELFTERFVSAQAKYLKGELTKEEFAEKTRKERDASFSAEEALAPLEPKKGAKSVRFQFGGWILPILYSTDDAFPKTEVKGRENPVYVMVRLETDGKSENYLLRLLRDDHNRWTADYFQPASEKIADGKNLPSAEFGVWFQ